MKRLLMISALFGALLLYGPVPASADSHEGKPANPCQAKNPCNPEQAMEEGKPGEKANPCQPTKPVEAGKAEGEAKPK